MTDILVSFQRLSRSFVLDGESVDALVEATGEIKRGDHIAIMGPSGSGKSTLLALMAKLDEPTDGSISWPAFANTKGLRPRHIGLAFQSPSLIPSLTVAENVEVPLLILGEIIGKSERALAALESVGLAALANRLPEELSGGQAQRIGVARALVTNPDLILADEPTGQLDQVTGTLLISALLAHAERTGAAIVVATHDPGVASRLKDVWQTSHGRLIAAQREKVSA